MMWGYVRSAVALAVGLFILLLIPQYSYDKNFVVIMGSYAAVCGVLAVLNAYITWDNERMRRSMLR